jgi:hypothetical protein
MKPNLPASLTPCGYPPGPVKASDGTRYLVTEGGQFRRLDRKMSKVDRKRHRKARRQGSQAGTPAPPEKSS